MLPLDAHSTGVRPCEDCDFPISKGSAYIVCFACYEARLSNNARVAALAKAMRGVKDPEAFVAKVRELIACLETDRDNHYANVAALNLSDDLTSMLPKEPPHAE